MKLHIKYNYGVLCRTVLAEQLDKLEVDYLICGIGEVELREALLPAKKESLAGLLQNYGIEILDHQKVTLVERIKCAIDEMLEEERTDFDKLSTYLADKLNYSYAYLSNLFSESTFTSIENFTILRRVDLAKDLLANTDLTLTEIAYRLKYSSVAHLSGQFKKTTGLTPTAFQRIIKKRKAQLSEQA